MIKGIINERYLRTGSMHMWQFKNGLMTQFTDDSVRSHCLIGISLHWQALVASRN